MLLPQKMQIFFIDKIFAKVVFFAFAANTQEAKSQCFSDVEFFDYLCSRKKVHHEKHWNIRRDGARN